MNRWILLLAALAAWASTAQAHGQRVVCYYGSWAVYRPGNGKYDVEDIKPAIDLCTHLIFTFIGIGDSGSVRVLDSWNELEDNYGKGAMKRFTNLCKNSNTKCLVAMGGWNEGSAKYSAVASNAAHRKAFAQNVKEFMEKFGFDGFDLDWEYPAQRGGKPEDKQNFSAMLRDLKEAFGGKYILSAATGAAKPSASQSYEIAEMCRSLDFVNIMTYDLHGSWEKVAGHNAPLYGRTGESGNDLNLNVDACVKYWLDEGCPADKIVLGVPFYARTFTLANPSQNGLGAPTNGPGTAGPFTREGGMLGYNEICVNLKQGGWSVVRHPEHRTPYAYKGNQWMGYDDPTSLEEKVKYVMEKGLGGLMMWSIETDDFRGECGVTYPLLRTMNIIRGGAPPVVDPVPTVQPPETTEPSGTQTQPPVTEPPAPPSGVCKQAGFVRDENDCSVFYQCVNVGGQYHAYRHTCGGGLAFDPAISACNHRHVVPGC